MPSIHRFDGVLDVYRQTLKSDGVRGFWKGNGTNVLKIMPESAAKFYTYEYLKSVVVADPEHVQVHERLLAGSSAGVVAQTSIYPMEVVKTRLAVSPPGTYSSIMDCLGKTIAAEGAGGLFVGLKPSIMGIIPYAGVDLAVYGTVRDAYIKSHPNEKPGDLTVLCMGAFSSFCGQIIAYPLQLVRTKMQGSGTPGMETYSSMGDCVRKVMARQGPKGFYTGISANFMKGIPAIAIGYVAYERARIFYQGVADGDRPWDGQ